MKQALIDGVVVAESDDVRVVEGMAYFPTDSVDTERLVESPTTSVCFWKGKARYWHVQGDDELAIDAAFAYPKPWPLGRWFVRDRIAFWQGVEVVEGSSLQGMARKLATEDIVEREVLLDFVRERHQWLFVTLRADGRPQTSPVTGGVNPDGQLVVSTYPSRDKVHNLRRDPRVSACVLSDNFGGAWVQVDGVATVTDVPHAVEGMVEYYRAVSGEHPDWDEYREAMIRQGKCLISVDIDRWGPIATGGFPPSLASIDDMVARNTNDQ